jgi:hypothetical protein
MVRSGWSAATLTPGDSVSIRMWPDRDAQQRHGQLMSLITADGVTLGRRDAPAPAVAPVASSIAGVWDALPHFGVPIIDQDVNPPRTYTAAGLAAKATFDLVQHPMASCVAYPTPLLTVVPYLNEIEIHADRVLIKNELNSIVRTVYTDGREHPANGERSNQGDSIGWWDDDVLVVDTRLFADYRLAHGVGVPSGAQKHTVERFALNADGTALEIEIVVEDPEFVVAPYTVTTTWDHAPDKAPQPFACNAENARLFTVR